MRNIFLLVGLVITISACSSQPQKTPPGIGMGTGDNSMMSRHHAEIPGEYAGLKNPIPADADSLERGASLYATNCASCHGEGGMGDGPAAAALDPAPAPVAYSSRMLADDYLFWRISEGGVPFGSSMPAWKTFDEEARWDMINYMHALGTGVTNRAGLSARAVEQGVITQTEADAFDFVHAAVERYRVEHPEIVNIGENAAEREAAILTSLVEAQIITRAEADAFTEIHDRLGTSGLMP